jgi:hypothetical protein
MTWWALLIFGVALVAATALIVWLITRRVRVDVDRVALSVSKEVRLKEELRLERSKRERLGLIAEELRERLEKNRIWFETRMEDIDEEVEKDFKDLASNDGALFDRLADLIGGRTEDVTPVVTPSGVGGEGRQVEKGREGEDGGDPPDEGDVGRDPEGGGASGS